MRLRSTSRRRKKSHHVMLCYYLSQKKKFASLNLLITLLDEQSAYLTNLDTQIIQVFKIETSESIYKNWLTDSQDKTEISFYIVEFEHTFNVLILLLVKS